MKISVIIVSYNAANYLELCLHSVKAALGNMGEIIVYDNASPERTIEKLPTKFPEINFVFSKENLGFSRANNAAVKIAKGDYILILNPDTVVPEDFFTQLLNFADSIDHLGAIGTRMIDAYGKFHPESKRNVPNPLNSFKKLFGDLFKRKNLNNGYYSEIDEYEVSPCEVLTGACMLMRRKTYLEIGGFDPKYFMYGEDIDLGYSLLNKGFQNYYYGKTTLIHYKGESSTKDTVFLKRFYGAMQIFIKKYYSQKLFLYPLLYIGLKIKHSLSWLALKMTRPSDETTTTKPKELKKWNKKDSQGHFLLETESLSFKEIIQIISNSYQSGNYFYIKTPDSKPLP